VTETLEATAASPSKPKGRTSHPIRSLLVRRLLSGVVSVVVISIVVYAATLVLPGDAATAILGQQATPQRLVELRHQLHLDQSPIGGYFSWAKGALPHSTAPEGDAIAIANQSGPPTRETLAQVRSSTGR